MPRAIRPRRSGSDREHRGPVDAVAARRSRWPGAGGRVVPVSRRASSRGQPPGRGARGQRADQHQRDGQQQQAQHGGQPGRRRTGAGPPSVRKRERRRVAEVEAGSEQGQRGHRQDAEHQGAAQQRRAVTGRGVPPRHSSRRPDRRRSRRTARRAPRPARPEHGGRRRQVGGHPEQGPGLEQPGDVERREQQGAEVVGDRADRVRRRRRRAAAARGHRRDAIAEATTSSEEGQAADREQHGVIRSDVLGIGVGAPRRSPTSERRRGGDQRRRDQPARSRRRRRRTSLPGPSREGDQRPQVGASGRQSRSAR